MVEEMIGHATPGSFRFLPPVVPASPDGWRSG